MASVAEICHFLDRFAPKELAESWDNVGLILGNRESLVQRLMTCLTVTETSAEEAVQRGAELIVTHHPMLFRPVQRLTSDDSQGRTILKLIRAGVAVYSPHTAFDSTAGGINELLASRLRLSQCAPLRPAASTGFAKIVVFVPDGDLERVSRALFDAGAGVIGEYRECSFRISGRGTFFGSDATNPTVGRAGQREEVDEWRLEARCPIAVVTKAIEAMKKAHSYEEPAYDVYPLAPQPTHLGAGRYGELTESTSLIEFAQRVRIALGASCVQVTGARDCKIRRVAVACGAASEFLSNAVAARCDVLVTGEASFHRQLEAESSGIAIIVAGHYATERFAVEELAATLKRSFQELDIWASQLERDPAWLVH